MVGSDGLGELNQPKTEKQHGHGKSPCDDAVFTGKKLARDTVGRARKLEPPFPSEPDTRLEPCSPEE